MLAGCFKVALVIINFVFLLVGLAFAAGGAILLFFPSKVLSPVYDSVSDAVSSMTSGQFQIVSSADDLQDFPLLYEIGMTLFILGIFLFILSFLGCCGSCCTCCRMLLIVFSIALIIIMIVEITFFGLFLTKDSPLHEEIKNDLVGKIPMPYVETNTDTFQLTMNLVNHNFDCCGLKGISDYGGATPLSCGSHTEGCYDQLQDIIQDNLLYAGLVAAGLLFLQLLEVIFAIVIFKDSAKVSPI